MAMITFKPGKDLENLKKRLKLLPKFMTNMIQSAALEDAEKTVKYFKQGIRGDTLNLERLQPNTIERKIKKGYTRPTTPLFGQAWKRKRYNNMMAVYQAGNKYYVRPKPGNYPGTTVPLGVIFDVHEYGATINNGFGRGIRIRIPPRPAFRYAYNRVLRERTSRQDDRRMRKAVLDYLRKGKKIAMRRVKVKNSYDD